MISTPPCDAAIEHSSVFEKRPWHYHQLCVDLARTGSHANGYNRPSGATGRSFCGECETPMSSRRSFACRPCTLRRVNYEQVNYSTLSPAKATTFCHLAVSSAIILPNSSGDWISGAPPRSTRRSLILVSVSDALIALLSFSTISFGVDFGAPMPNNALASSPGTVSAI